MEITGRITADATVKTVKGDRTVVAFSVAVNDRYKPKDGEVVENTNFFNCSYWMGEGIAPFLTKGTLVQVVGRLTVNAWKDMNGEPRASLNLHTNEIKLLGKPATQNTPAVAEETTGKSSKKKKAATTADDDLPF